MAGAKMAFYGGCPKKHGGPEVTEHYEMSKPKAPKAPDPAKTAAAQTGSNIATAAANTAMGNVNQVTPEGSLSYAQSGTYKYTDPATGRTYDVPTFTATQKYSPEQQRLYETGVGTQQNLADLAKGQSSFLQDYMAKPFDGTNDATEARLIEFGRKRLDPMFADRRASMEQDLANRGIAMGSRAYDSAMRRSSEAENDAYNQLLLTGNSQAFSQGQATRNQPINEITALMSGSQVSQPNYASTNAGQIANTDFAGLQQQAYANQMNAYNQKMQQGNSIMGGLFGLGAAAIGAGGLVSPAASAAIRAGRGGLY
jgi:hypothetical protein